MAEALRVGEYPAFDLVFEGTQSERSRLFGIGDSEAERITLFITHLPQECYDDPTHQFPEILTVTLLDGQQFSAQSIVELEAQLRAVQKQIEHENAQRVAERKRLRRAAARQRVVGVKKATT